MKTHFLAKVIFATVCATSLFADDTPTQALNKRTPAPARFAAGVSEVSYETGWQISASSSPRYHLAPQVVSYHYQLDDVGLEGWKRGNAEWIVSGFFVPVLKGPESRFAGIVFGPRYNFVQEGWKWVPYVESRLGVAFTDSNTSEAGSQGQDFCFTFQVGVGTRYIINDNWSVSAGAMYQHYSNGGLSEPDRLNNGLDAVGPLFSVLYKF